MSIAIRRRVDAARSGVWDNCTVYSYSILVKSGADSQGLDCPERFVHAVLDEDGRIPSSRTSLGCWIDWRQLAGAGAGAREKIIMRRGKGPMTWFTANNKAPGGACVFSVVMHGHRAMVAVSKNSRRS